MSQILLEGISRFLKLVSGECFTEYYVDKIVLLMVFRRQQTTYYFGCNFIFFCSSADHSNDCFLCKEETCKEDERYPFENFILYNHL